MDFLLYGVDSLRDLTNGLFSSADGSHCASSPASAFWNVCSRERGEETTDAINMKDRAVRKLGLESNLIMRTCEWVCVLPAWWPAYGRFRVFPSAGCVSPPLRFHPSENQRWRPRFWWLRGDEPRLWWYDPVGPARKDSIYRRKLKCVFMCDMFANGMFSKPQATIRQQPCWSCTWDYCS